MDNSTEMQEKFRTMAENGCANDIKGWVRGDNDVFYNLSHFSSFAAEKNHHWDGYSVVGKRYDGEEVYIKTFEEWTHCTLWLLNVMGVKK